MQTANARKGVSTAKQTNEANIANTKHVANTTTKNFGFKKWINQNFLNKKMQVNYWSRFPLEFQELISTGDAITTLTNQVLPCGENGLNQLCEAYTSGLIPSKGTSKIAGVISVVNMIGLTGEKKKEISGNSREMSLTG